MGEVQGEECGSVGPRGSSLPKHREQSGGRELEEVGPCLLPARGR